MGAVTETSMEMLLQNVRAARQMTDAAEERLKKSREVLAGHESALRTAITGGATTGDPMLDIVMRCHCYDLAVVEKFRALDAELKGKTGEFALIAFDASGMKSSHTFGESHVETRTYCRIAVLTGDTLLWQKQGHEGHVTMPSVQFVTCEVARILGKIPHLDALDGDLFARTYYADPRSLGLLVLEDSWRYNLFIGDDAVKTYLASKGMSPLFGAATEKLGRLILQPTDENSV